MLDRRVRPHLGVRRRARRPRSPTRAGCSPALSTFWFEQTARPAAQPPDLVRPDRLPRDRRARRRRPGDARARRPDPVRLECIARGYLFGSAWSEYQATGARSTGRALPAGLRQAERLPEPIFTPTTKAEAGHDLPLTDAEAAELVGDELLRAAARRHARALRVRRRARGRARGSSSPTRSSSSATIDGELLVIDEMLTPDSSRYWPADEYRVGIVAAVVRQAVRARPLPRDRLGPEAAGAARAGRRRSPARARATSRRTSCITGRSFDDWYGRRTESDDDRRYDWPR